MIVWNEYNNRDTTTYPVECTPLWVFTFSTEHIGLATFSDRPPIKIGNLTVCQARFLLWGDRNIYYEYKSACDVSHWAYAVLPDEPHRETVLSKYETPDEWITKTLDEN